MADGQNQIRMNEIDPELAIQLFSAFSKIARILLKGLLLVGIGISGYAGKTVYEASSSRAWSTVQGQVVSASVEQEIVRGRRIDRLHFRYAYAVEGKRYVGERVTIGPNFGPFAPKAVDVVAEYRLRSVVTVFYHPEDPNRSVLKPGVTPTVFFVAFIGPLMIIVSLWGLRSLDLSETRIRSKLTRPGGPAEPSVLRTAPRQHQAPAPAIGPKPIGPGSYEGTRRRVIAVLIALLIALLVAGFFRGEVDRWVEKIRKEFGYSEKNRTDGSTD